MAERLDSYAASTCKDYAPENVTAVRYITLNLLRQEHTRHISLRQKRLLCSFHEHSLLTVLSRVT